jgi:hypothetical protein
VSSPAVSCRSLIPMGSPRSGPRSSPRRTATSAAFASLRARSYSSLTGGRVLAQARSSSIAASEPPPLLARCSPVQAPADSVAWLGRGSIPLLARREVHACANLRALALSRACLWCRAPSRGLHWLRSFIVAFSASNQSVEFGTNRLHLAFVPRWARTRRPYRRLCSRVALAASFVNSGKDMSRQELPADMGGALSTMAKIDHRRSHN